MITKLSRFAQQKLKKKQYVRCLTSFVTKDGPAIGTIWWYESNPKKPPRTVIEVEMERKVPLVRFEGGESIALSLFITLVDLGVLILMGIVPDSCCHTEI